MSEKLQQPDNDDILVPAGYEGNPSLYGEEQLMHEYSTMTTDALEAKAQRFIGILNDPTTLPKHRAVVAHLIDHIVFEVTYRDVTARRSEENSAWVERGTE